MNEWLSINVLLLYDDHHNSILYMHIFKVRRNLYLNIKIDILLNQIDGTQKQGNSCNLNMNLFQ